MAGLTYAPGQAPVSFTTNYGGLNASPGTTPGLTFNSGQPLNISTPVPKTTAPSVVDSAQADFAKLLAEIKNATLAASQKVYAPKLDFAAINSQARSAAENAVNPYYTKTLNDFLAQQAATRARAQTQSDTNIKDLEDTLKQTQDANALSKERTGADVALNQEQINTTADQNQVDTGTSFEDARIQQAKDLAAAGVIGSGAGNRITGTTTANRNTTEGRQEAKFQEQRNQQELFKTRTFEDLAKSNELALTGTEKGKKQVQFDLDKYLEGLSFDEQNKRNSLEQERLSAVGQETGNQSKLLINNFINSIADPAKRQAALEAYA